VLKWCSLIVYEMILLIQLDNNSNDHLPSAEVFRKVTSIREEKLTIDLVILKRLNF